MLRAGRVTPKIVLITSFILALGVGYWGIAFNRGYILVDSDIRPFIIDGMYDTPTKCDQASCKYEVNPKAYNLIISADGYTNQNTSINVKRGKETMVTYKPNSVPELKETRPTQVLNELFYISKKSGKTIEIWQRDRLSDQLIVSYESDDTPQRLIESPYSRYLLIETTGGDHIAINLMEKSKKQFDLPSDWLDVALLGTDHIVWQEESGVYYGRLENFEQNRTKLQITELEHMTTSGPAAAIFISQVPLAGAQSQNGSGSSFTDIVAFKEETNEIAINQTYFLYEMNLTDQNITYLKELTWTEKNKLGFVKAYNQDDLTLRTFLEVDGDFYELNFINS